MLHYSLFTVRFNHLHEFLARDQITVTFCMLSINLPTFSQNDVNMLNRVCAYANNFYSLLISVIQMISLFYVCRIALSFVIIYMNSNSPGEYNGNDITELTNTLNVQISFELQIN